MTADIKPQQDNVLPDIAEDKAVKGMFEGSILKLMIRLALPMFFGMTGQLIYNITDIIWISRIDLADSSYVGGVGLIFPIILFALALADGLMIGTSSLVARSIGKRDTRTLNRTAESGMAMAVMLSIIMMAVFYGFGKRIVGSMSDDPDIYTHAIEFLYYIVPAAVGAFVGMVLYGILQGEGAMKLVMISMILGMVANIILDPVFIFILGLQVKGAALATTISQFLSVFCLISVFLQKKTTVPITWKISNIDFSVIKNITAIGVPQALGQVLMSFSFIVLNIIVVRIDPNALTASTLCGRVDQIILMPVFAMGSALITMVGQNFGRQNWQRMKKIWQTVLASALVITVLMVTAVFLLAPVIYPLLSDVNGVIYYAVLQTRIVNYSFVLAAVSILAGSLFQAVNKPGPAFGLIILRMVAIPIPVIFYCVYVLDLKMYGVWAGVVTGSLITAVFSYIWAEKTIKHLQHPHPGKPL